MGYGIDRNNSSNEFQIDNFLESSWMNPTSNRSQNSDTYATDTYADLIRAEYDDYKLRFQPYEEKLMSLADSEAMLDQQLSKISASGVSRYKKAQNNSALMDQRYGVQSNARQTNYSNTQLDGRRGLDTAQAKNMSRLQSEDSKSNILSGAGTTRQLANQG